MHQDPLVSAMIEDISEPDRRFAPEEQVRRLQFLVAHLLERNEQLRNAIATQLEEQLPGKGHNSYRTTNREEF